ncbi:MAG: class I SAM-dependent methyltransferase [Clostridiales bacterium]
MEQKIKNFQSLEDIATAPWFGQILFTAVEKKIFDAIKSPTDIIKLSEFLNFTEDATFRFLQILGQMELITLNEKTVENTAIANTYLVTDAPLYQGHSILWRKHLCESWENLDEALKIGGRANFPEDNTKEAIKKRFLIYSLAMDDIARCKAQEIGNIFKNIKISGKILDLGSGMGAISRYFLEENPQNTAVFCDIEDVLDICKDILPKNLQKRINFCNMNILQPWVSLKNEKFDLVVMSNIVHAFDTPDNTALLTKVSQHLTKDGIVLIHDFFHDHCPIKAGIMDINMLINTYNGKIFAYEEIVQILKDSRIPYAKAIALPSDTALIVGAKNEKALLRIEANQ